jgi:hypothetical protein
MFFQDDLERKQLFFRQGVDEIIIGIREFENIGSGSCVVFCFFEISL